VSAADTYTASGALVRLVVVSGDVVGAVVVECPLLWVYRKPHLVREDVD